MVACFLFSKFIKKQIVVTRYPALTSPICFHVIRKKGNLRHLQNYEFDTHEFIHYRRVDLGEYS